MIDPQPLRAARPMRAAIRQAALGGAALLALSAASAQDPASPPPNILFVFSDDHAPHAIGAYGGRLAGIDPTPNIDRLAEQGLRFENSFCTNSICGPSRAVVLTGKHSHLNGFRKNGERFDPDQQTLPKMLRAGGYTTALIGKWHLQSEPQGFDHWDVLPGQGHYYNPVLIDAEGRRRVEGHVTSVVTDLALDWLDERHAAGDDQPWLLMCQYKAPHRNWMPAPEHLDLYDDITLPVPETLFDAHRDDASPARHQEMTIAEHMDLVYDLFLTPEAWAEAYGEPWNPEAAQARDSSGFRNLRDMTDAQRAAWDAAFADENAAFAADPPAGDDLVRWKYQRYMKNYLRCVRGVDDSVGRLLDWLDESGLAENTIVVYSSDQGFFLGDHGWFDKRWMYEESLRMPLIVRWPGVIEPGTVSDALVQNLDYAPTFLDAAGAGIPADMQGRSLLPLLPGAQPPGGWRDAIYYHYHGFPAVHMVARHYGIRTQRHKLIHYYQFDEWELFDLVRDPDERNNVYGDPAYRDVTTRLAERLGALRVHYADDTDVSPMPHDWRQRHR